MNLDEIRKSEAVLLDANILLYGVLLKSDQCVRLLRRCAERDVVGVIGLQQLAEVMHRLMMIEARENNWSRGANPARSLSEHPERVRAMTRYSDATKGLLASGFRFEPILREDFLFALALQHQYGLLTNDSLFIAVAERLRIKAVASADKTFARVRSITLYGPNDLKI